MIAILLLELQETKRRKEGTGMRALLYLEDPSQTTNQTRVFHDAIGGRS
jgi:hypothetical protein